MPKSLSRISMRRLRKLSLLVMDVDGVLTDGKLYYSVEGHVLKAFNVHDGQGLRNLHAVGVRSSIISVSAAELIKVRAQELNIRPVLINQSDKGEAMVRLLAETGCSKEHSAYIGDDIPDLAAMEQVAVSITVPNAHPDVLARAEFVTKKAGGEGAVRELCDLICRVKVN